MNCKVVFFALAFFILPAQLVVAAASIQGPSPQQLTFQFSPGDKYVMPFSVSGAASLRTYLAGDLAEYGILHDEQSSGGPPRSIEVELILPENMTPGEHILLVGVMEMPPEGAQVGGVAAAQRRVVVNVLYPTPLVRIDSFSVKDVAVNSTSTVAQIVVKSLTKVDLVVFAVVNITDANGTLFAEERTPIASLSSGGSVTLEKTMPTKSLVPGPYPINAVVHYADNITSASSIFRVGTLDFDLIAYQQELIRDKINPFVFTIQSRWNERVDGVTATVKIGEVQERTPSITVAPFADAEMKTFIDSSGMNGTVDGSITLRTPGGDEVFPISVQIVNATVPAPAEESADVKKGFFIPINGLTILYIALILLVIFNLILLFRRKKKDDGAS